MIYIYIYFYMIYIYIYFHVHVCICMYLCQHKMKRNQALECAQGRVSSRTAATNTLHLYALERISSRTPATSIIYLYALDRVSSRTAVTSTLYLHLIDLVYADICTCIYICTGTQRSSARQLLCLELDRKMPLYSGKEIPLCLCNTSLPLPTLERLLPLCM